MMNQHLTHLIANGLRDAFKAACSSQVGSERDQKICFKRMVYSKERNLVVVEIRREQWLDLPKSLFDGEAIKRALHKYLACSRVDIMDLGESINIYCWVEKTVWKNFVPNARVL